MMAPLLKVLLQVRWHKLLAITQPCRDGMRGSCRMLSYRMQRFLPIWSRLVNPDWPWVDLWLPNRYCCLLRSVPEHELPAFRCSGHQPRHRIPGSVPDPGMAHRRLLGPRQVGAAAARNPVDGFAQAYKGSYSHCKWCVKLMRASS